MEEDVEDWAVVSRETGYLYAVGETPAEARSVAKEGIVDDVERHVDRLEPGESTWFPTYRLLPCTEPLRESVYWRGGHEDWRVENGTVVLTGEVTMQRFDLLEEETGITLERGESVEVVMAHDHVKGRVVGANRFHAYVEDEEGEIQSVPPGLVERVDDDV